MNIEIRACARALALLLSFSLAGSAFASSAIERYRAKKGDTLELLAAEYYGNRKHKIYLMVENNIDHDVALTPGKRLSIPVSKEITADAGESWSSVALTHLGDERRGSFLASFNNFTLNDSIAAGQTIRIPMRVTYRAGQATSLRDVALSLFGKGQRSKFLRDYNFLSSDKLKPGDAITVPILDVETQRAKRPPQDEESNARAAKRAEMLAQAQIALPAARSAWKEGDFAAIKKRLVSLETDYLDQELAADVGIVLGATYIAYDDTDSALQRFVRVLQRSPGRQLDEKEYSPKVIAVWKQAQARLKAAP